MHSRVASLSLSLSLFLCLAILNIVLYFQCIPLVIFFTFASLRISSATACLSFDLFEILHIYIYIAYLVRSVESLSISNIYLYFEYIYIRFSRLQTFTSL